MGLFGNKDDSGEKLESSLTRAAKSLGKYLDSQSREAAAEITSATYYALGISSGRITKKYSEGAINAVNGMNTLTGAAKRICALEEQVCYQKSIIRDQRSKEADILKKVKESWRALYNSNPYNKVGVVQVTNPSQQENCESRIVNQNDCFINYFGNLRRVRLNVLEHYDLEKGGKQKVTLADEEFLMQPIQESDLSSHEPLTFKFMKQGWFASMISDEEDTETRHQAIIDASEETLKRSREAINERLIKNGKDPLPELEN